MKGFIFSIFLLFSIQSSFGQCPLNSPEVLLMADGLGSTYSWHCGLYDNSQVGSAGNITTITFKLDNPAYANYNYDNQSIYMRHSAIVDYNGNQTYPTTTGFTLVWTGTFNMTPGFHNITLATPFNYDGNSVLEVMFINKEGSDPAWGDDVWFDRTNASPSYSGKFGAGYSWSGAKSNNTKRVFNLAIGFNAINTVNCGAFDPTLPIRLASFSAKNKLNTNIINWKTYSETNNDYYTIERSFDGVNFEEIKIIKGAGNSSEILSYNFKDFNLLKGIYYYRLKQTDFDGEFTYSDIISAEVSVENKISIYPNPVHNVLTVNVKFAEYLVNIYTMDGRLVYSESNCVKVDISDFIEGVYQIIILSENEIISTEKLIKINE